jgi:16S rRNA (adenine1518-N6/adenine1519-N6)-dimethyltransferase
MKSKNELVLNPLKDQFLINNNELSQKIVDAGQLKKGDIVLEIGAGTGNLTKLIAAKASKVIAYEIDNKFEPYLYKMPKNVDVRIEEWKSKELQGKFKKKKEYNKIIANPPYSLVEPLLHNLTFLDYDKVILVVPIKLVNKIKKGIFGSFFNPEIKLNINKSNFTPAPKTNSVVLDLIKLDNPIKSKNLILFLKQYIYTHEKQLVKNSLMEGLIKFEKLVNEKIMTKNEARKIIADSKIPAELLNKFPTNDIYEMISLINEE